MNNSTDGNLGAKLTNKLDELKGRYIRWSQHAFTSTVEPSARKANTAASQASVDAAT